MCSDSDQNSTGIVVHEQEPGALSEEKGSFCRLEKAVLGEEAALL